MLNQFPESFSASQSISLAVLTPVIQRLQGRIQDFFLGGGCGGLLAGWLVLWGHDRINVACSQSVAI